MAADDDFPRGLTQTASAGANITYPAIPGISWVLTSINATMTDQAGGAAFETTVTVNGNVYILVGSDTGGVGAEASGTWTGKQQFPVGAAVTIAWSAAIGQWIQQLVTDAYPV